MVSKDGRRGLELDLPWHPERPSSESPKRCRQRSLTQGTTTGLRRCGCPGPGEAPTNVETCGVGASDVKCFKHAGAIGSGNCGASWQKAPVIPGHKFIGPIARVGSGAAQKFGLRAGDRVITKQILSCDGCQYYSRGQYGMYEVQDAYGFQHHVNGAMAKVMKISANSLVRRVLAEIPLGS